MNPVTQKHPCYSCDKPTDAKPIMYIDKKIIVCSVECFKFYAFGHKKPKVLKKYINESKI